MPAHAPTRSPVVIIGAGFTGLAAAYQLTLRGFQVSVLEADSTIGGLAGSFIVGGQPLERFYHHWFTSDEHIYQLIRELDREDQVVLRPTRTAMYFGTRTYRLSSPLDVLRFSPLSMLHRLRLGILVLRARRVSSYGALESVSARDWLIRLGGREVYRVVWEPLLRGKFGSAADNVSAVWMANKLRLRGGSRGNRGEERLAYYRGGFSALAAALREKIEAAGGVVITGLPATGLRVNDGQVRAVVTPRGELSCTAVLATPALPIIADLIAPHAEPDVVASLRGIRYLGNVCVVLALDRSLSSAYWLNVNDPSFPFVAVIEHTNFEPGASYAGQHIVYLSRYLPATDPLFEASDADLIADTLPHLRRMFPEFGDAWVSAAYVWRATYAQPIVEVGYGNLVPPRRSTLRGLYVSTMAQIYPEDRGTNYAVREGRSAADLIADDLERDAHEA